MLLTFSLCLSEVPATAVNNSEYSKIVAESGYLSFRSADGFKVYGRLYGPASISKPLPVIIELHGGPHNNCSNTPKYIYKTLVDSGYLVLAVNYRGSSGYDSKYFNKIVGNVGRGDVEDVVAAAKELQKFSFVQKDRIFVLGHSYGGYLVYMAISKYPDYFKGGIAMSGPVDLEKQLKLLKQNVLAGRVPASVLDEMQADLSNTVLSRSSPSALIDKVSKPILIIHGMKDAYCPIEPIKQYAIKLKAYRPDLIETWFLPDYGHDLGISNENEHAHCVFSKVIFWMKQKG